jgi:hypothetical protein
MQPRVILRITAAVDPNPANSARRFATAHNAALDAESRES